MPSSHKSADERIAVIGLGYVGLPLGVELAKKYRDVRGFDIDADRVAQLCLAHDNTNEVDDTTLAATTMKVTSDPSVIANATLYIVTVPTPIDGSKRPDLNPLRNACRLIGEYLRKGDVVVFESTVYPGVTEDICAPILSEVSGLVASQDFGLAYSAERISPGDKKYSLTKIVKNVAGDTQETRDRVATVYQNIIEAGVFKVPSIKVAEAAKVLENTQRDLNIALMNELSLICHLMDVRTTDVIEAAATKWNFMPFVPGLVGGHCISVDPYYLTARAEELGYHPEVILAGRRINDNMPKYIAQSAVKLLAQRAQSIRASKIGILGVTFKENVPDMRNSKVAELISELREYGLSPLAYDPVATSADAAAMGVELVDESEMNDLDLVILAVPHDTILQGRAVWERVCGDGILMDIKSRLRNEPVPGGLEYWCL